MESAHLWTIIDPHDTVLVLRQSNPSHIFFVIRSLVESMPLNLALES